MDCANDREPQLRQVSDAVISSISFLRRLLVTDCAGRFAQVRLTLSVHGVQFDEKRAGSYLAEVSFRYLSVTQCPGRARH
jgi:hypothetical protein